MLTKIIFLPPNSSSYSCQRCLVLNKSNNALPNFDKEPDHDGDGDVVDEADWWRWCWQFSHFGRVLKMSEMRHLSAALVLNDRLSQWQRSHKIDKMDDNFTEKVDNSGTKKTIKLSTELWSGFVVLFCEVSIQQLQSLTGDQTEINADFQQTEGNSFIREKK